MARKRTKKKAPSKIATVRRQVAELRKQLRKLTASERKKVAPVLRGLLAIIGKAKVAVRTGGGSFNLSLSPFNLSGPQKGR